MKLKEYDHSSHEKFIMRFHIIFSTKYRQKCLFGLEFNLKSYMELAENQQNKWWIETMEIDNGDHIHLLIRSTPSVKPSDIVHKLKQVSTYYMWKNHRNIMRNFYWKSHHLWTRGYFLSTIGDVSVETIKKYIESQG